MSTEIAVRAATLPEKMQYAEALAYSGMLPEQYRKQPANVLWAVEYGETIGITPMAAITGVHMIEGKPTASAALISGLVRRAGHRLRSGYNAATRTGWAEIVRSDDPDYTFRSEWSLDRAVEAELVQVGPNGELIAKDSKGRSKPWKKFYPSMTKARAITEVARDACEEVLFGLHYTPEELGADTDDEGNLVVRAARAAFVAQDNPWQTPAPAAEAKPAEAEAQAEAEYADVVEDRPPGADPGQLASILAALQARGINDRGQALKTIIDAAGRQIGAPADLTAAEADRVLAQLTAPTAEPEQQNEALPEVDGPRPHQMKMMFALIRKKGHTKDGAYVLMGQVFKRQITSAKQLSPEEADAFIKLLDTGELQPGMTSPGPAPEDEGISVVDALRQIIDDAHTEDEFDQARADIEREHAEGGIGGDQLAALQAHWVDRRNEQLAKVGASA